MLTRKKRNANRRRGAILILVAVLLPVILWMAAFCVDVAYMQLTRTELRIATDAAARAGARTLSLEQDASLAHAAAIEYAAKNNVAGNTLTLADSDVEIGLSVRVDDEGRFEFSDGGTLLNSVHVTGRRTLDSPDGAVRLYLTPIFGHEFFQPATDATASQIDRDIALVVDRSGSMTFKLSESKYQPGWKNNDPVPAGARWWALVDSVDGFLNELGSTPQLELVSLSSYNSSATIDQNLTDNYSKITQAIEKYSKKYPDGSTNITAGMDKGIQTLQNKTYARPYASKTMVVMTDGNHNFGSSPTTAAYDAADADIVVHTITYGGDANEYLMREVARIGGGQHWHAPTEADLEEVFREIARNAPTLLTY
ncbi:VWA domain-containing protein [Blastopirellula sp. JC732]|uniref:VWA domain-containing protein n=1 Tax=Blastopirellula sediminis TaxID=2894196 RepID=A0A9X1MQZ2_9BACT|nr:vWA domain-containing protein [Blastopirellula sediminis]MCC9605946.1 VWA domain-containing protein [Blastopirellula sediminis]MCC9630755.1 VWA domain-containing protein [Blastopirellula sediminis]